MQRWRSLQLRCTQKNLLQILLNQTDIRLYLPFADWFGTKRTSVWFQINGNMVDTIWFRFDIIRFRKDFFMCEHYFDIEADSSETNQNHTYWVDLKINEEKLMFQVYILSNIFSNIYLLIFPNVAWCSPFPSLSNFFFIWKKNPRKINFSVISRPKFSRVSSLNSSSRFDRTRIKQNLYRKIKSVSQTIQRIKSLERSWRFFNPYVYSLNEKDIRLPT